ncbi:MAG: glycine cleavage system protein H, partial [Caulobacterales bacterium]
HGDMAVVESAKAASDVYAPVAGEVTAVNDKLNGAPELVNESAEGDGWFVKLKLSDPKALESLMDKAAYDAFLKELG